MIQHLQVITSESTTGVRRNWIARWKIHRRSCRLLACLADKWLKKSPLPSPIYRCLESLGLSHNKDVPPSSLLRVFHNPVVASSDKRHCSCEAAQPNNCLIDAAQLSWIAYLLHRLPFTLRAHPSRARQLLFHPRGTARRRGAISSPFNPLSIDPLSKLFVVKKLSYLIIHKTKLYQRCKSYPLRLLEYFWNYLLMGRG